jgi:hypothetical protein
MTRLLLTLMLAALVQAAALAQRSPDFAEKFMTLCAKDSTVKCVTVSPKMMAQLVKQNNTDHPENLLQAMSKLKSARIVTASTDYYQKAEDLLTKNSRRFKAQRTYRNGEQHGSFFTRKDRKGRTVEFIMLHEDCSHDRLTIVCLTGNIDEEFLCFLYNYKTFKN